MNLQRNKEAIYTAIKNAAIDAHRAPESVSVIAVTKYVDSSIAKKLIETGIKHIGENRVDKFLEKYHTLADENITWHLIGTLQRRKVKDVINYVDYFHALDSLKLAEEIQKRATKPVKCFLQVNISGEKTKHGFKTEELDATLASLADYNKVELVGLMTMAPLEASQEELQQVFSKAQSLQQELASRKLPHMPFTELSMGMSGDFSEAIQHGSTFVRIGTAFFK